MIDRLKSGLTTSLKEPTPSAFKILAACLFAAVLAVPTAANAQAAACVAGETQQNFVVPAGGWPAGSLGPVAFTVGTGANAVTLTYTITNAVASSDGHPQQVATFGGLPNVVRNTHITNVANTSLSTQTLTFTRPINKFVYVATDVDLSGWQDAISARANGTVLPTSLVGAATHTINNITGTATATSGGNCADNDPACNVTANFNFNGINSASMEFRTGPTHGGAQQRVGWTSFGFCVPNRSNLTLRKVWVDATVGNTATVAGTGLTSLGSVAETANETDTGVVQIVNAGAVINLSEVITPAAASANYNSVLTCTGTSGLAGNALTVGAADTDIVCTYTNTRRIANLTVTKNDSKTTTVSGDTNTYSITVTNNGPLDANNTLVTDPAVTGLTCSTVTCPSANASCPVVLTVAALQGPGLTIPTLLNGGSVTLTLTCSVNATGV